MTGLSEEDIARAVCRSWCFETGEGTCAVICMDQLGDVRKKGCHHAQRVHKRLIESIAELDAARQDGRPSREEIARIIDPLAYEDFPVGGPEPDHDWWDREQALRKADAILALASPPPGAADGWRLEAQQALSFIPVDAMGWAAEVRSILRAMLSAAPQPPAQEQQPSRPDRPSQAGGEG